MCSVGPMGRDRAALERLGFDEAATRFYSEHVLADERHQVVALHEMAAQLVEQEPMLGGEVIFGAKALPAVEALLTRHLPDRWSGGRSSLLIPTMSRTTAARHTPSPSRPTPHGRPAATGPRQDGSPGIGTP